MNLSALIAVALALFCQLAVAVPVVPTHDAEVVEVLPGASGGRIEERRLRRQFAQRPNDAALALTLARRYLARAHEQGDPRFAGQALAVLTGWTDADAPDDILLVRADLQQYLHDFDASVQSLQRLLARPEAAKQSQPWITLATVRRVQGRYADSDQACRELAATGATVHAAACLAENAALRGNVDAARATLVRLLASPGASASIRAWLFVTQAELEQRAGRAAEADAAYCAALALQPDAYARLAYADFLIEQKRPADALTWLKDEPRNDAVLLRLAIAGKLAWSPAAARDAAEMRERIALANQRPDARLFHGREQAMFALWVDSQASLAWTLARGNAAHQREPLDLLLLAQAARASREASALEEARSLKRQVGLHDRRTEALL